MTKDSCLAFASFYVSLDCWRGQVLKKSRPLTPSPEVIVKKQRNSSKMILTIKIVTKYISYNSFFLLFPSSFCCDLTLKCTFLLLHESMIPEFAHDVFFQVVGTIVILRFWSVICSTIGKHPFHIGNVQTLVAVIIRL